MTDLNATVVGIPNFFGGMTNIQMIIIGILLVFIIFLIVAIFIVARRKDDKVPDTLPPLPTPPEHDFRKILILDIEHKTRRLEEIKATATQLEVEYRVLKSDLLRLETLRGLI